MFIARVTGSVVSTQKVDSMTGHKLLVVEPYRLESKKRQSLVTTGRTFIAVDTLGAGEDDYVFDCSRQQRSPHSRNKTTTDRCGHHRHCGQSSHR